MSELTGNAQAQSIPSHIPPELVVDFDLYHPVAEMGDLQAFWHELQRRTASRIFWTPRNGGHWVVLDGIDVERVMHDYEHFSSTEIMIPPNPGRPYPQVPIEMDPPESVPFRRVMLRPLMPDRMPAMEPKVRKLTVDLIEGFKARGECEFMDEFAFVLPISIFLGMMDLPAEDRDMLKPWADAMTKSPSAEERANGQRQLQNYIATWVSARQSEPKDDIVSYIVTADVGGRRMTHIEATSMCAMLLLGGLDTVANMLGFFVMFLARNADKRAELRADPSLIKPATEELLRRFALVAGGRRVAKTTTIQGATLHPGEMVQVPSMLYGLDDKLVSEPLKVDFSRAESEHRTFGDGIHVCPGQHLARRELRIFLEEWLQRIPDFRIKEGSTPRIVSGLVSGPTEIHLEWPTGRSHH